LTLQFSQKPDNLAKLVKKIHFKLDSLVNPEITITNEKAGNNPVIAQLSRAEIKR